ncbi:MAG: HAMP domain-containing sensor histidine kinase [Pseudohongiellaceae bacterium]
MSVLYKLNNLRTVLLLQVALPVLLLLGGLLAAALGVIGQFAEERLQRDLRQVARAIQLPVAQALERNDPGQLVSSLESVFEISEVYGAYLFDVNGDRLVSFGSVNPSRRQADRALQLTVDGEQEFAQYEQISGRNVYSFFLPLFDNSGRPNGLLQVTRRRSDIEAELGLLKSRAWIGFSVVFLLMLLCLTLAHHRVIGKPLSRLSDSMQKVGTGARSHRAELGGPREIQQLASGLNSMLDAIQQAEVEAREGYKEKEKITHKLRHAETMAVLGQLSAGIAHELGSPLSVVDGRARRLLRKESDTDQQAELNTIRQQVARMSALIQQLLSFGRSSRAKQISQDLAELFSHVKILADNEGWRIHFVTAENIRIMGDPFSLEQAIMNLLRNARQACPSGEVRAGWFLNKDTDKAIIYVEDAGPGIDPAVEDQLFEPFVTTKTPGEGSGMGLAIVQRVVRDHQGEVKVSRSELGGARIELSFPHHRETD